MDEWGMRYRYLERSFHAEFITTIGWAVKGTLHGDIWPEAETLPDLTGFSKTLTDLAGFAETG